jgi:hypothetical protein
MHEDPRRVSFFGAVSPLLAVSKSDRLASYDDSACDKGHYEQDQEYDEEDLGEFCGYARNATEAECRCDESNQQEY